MKKDKALTPQLPDGKLIRELSVLIEQSRKKTAAAVNSALVMLYWQIGKRINSEILFNKRAEYGKQIVMTVSGQLEKAYGRSFNEKNIQRMMQFAEQFPEKNCRSTGTTIKLVTYNYTIASKKYGF